LRLQLSMLTRAIGAAPDLYRASISAVITLIAWLGAAGPLAISSAIAGSNPPCAL